MTKRATAVIGANYGDEAKGANVDRLADGDSVVVRFNGGAQAGHTVTAPDGRRHVFHHVGSGAFRGAATFLSRHFVSNPMTLLSEIEDLAALGVVPKVMADPRGALTTPFDMLVNQVAETFRGGARHGSTGLGFGETIERSERSFGTTIDDLEDLGALASKLARIRDAWVPARLAALGVTEVPRDYVPLLAGDDLVEAYLVACARFRETVSTTGTDVVRRAPSVVFEGAQGLALDQERGDFPFVTRSYTGIRNALDVAREAGLAGIDVTYATRCYMTRHGAGPLVRETPVPPVPGFADATNVPNPWQGTLRYAVLDADALADRVLTDLSDATGSGVDVRADLAVSCLDHADRTVPLHLSGEQQAIDVDDVAPLLLERLGFARGTAAFGPDRTRVRAVAASDRSRAAAPA